MRRVSKARTSDVEQLAGRLAALAITIVLMAMVVLILGACGNTAQAGSGTSGGDAAAAARVALTKATRDVIRTGLWLIGIEAPERM